MTRKTVTYPDGTQEELEVFGLPEPSDANLPAVVVKQVRKRGDLIDRSAFSEEQNARVRQIVDGFDISDTAATLLFAAEPQKQMSKFLDELLVGIKTEDVGIAGELAMQMAEGIDLMSLHKVKEQIQNPPSTALWARFWRWVTGWKNAIHAFYLAKTPVLKLIDEMERKAQNRIETLKSKSDDLDALAERADEQVGLLAVWIAAGEEILLREQERYGRERERVLQSEDPREASRLRDLGRQIAAFEVRLLEVQTAYVRASSVTIPRVRMVQEAIKIEIQNISEHILFRIPQFKEAIVMVAALKDIYDAQSQRRMMEENQRYLDEIVNDAMTDGLRVAKESQGDALARVEQLEKTVMAIKTAIDTNVEIENKTRQQREEAAKRLAELKGVITDALKQANIDAAQTS